MPETRKMAPLLGGPLDGEKSPVPLTPRPPNGIHGKAFGDYLYSYCEIKGVLAWHYGGKVKWTPEEAERRRREMA